ncbi:MULTISPECIES: hypothetical protein [unclassified Methylobacterium]|uniref:hypothetical protein n=1 Tax=unclassified Methylobacterium TaxID=2615210 RepID=UPI0009EB804C|nr:MULTISPECIES: hypothetical protein [unclassified Methylobacterium]
MADKTDDRADRLKAALRDNLRRRKDQSRARAEAPPPGRDGGRRDPPDAGDEPASPFRPRNTV